MRRLMAPIAAGNCRDCQRRNSGSSSSHETHRQILGYEGSRIRNMTPVIQHAAPNQSEPFAIFGHTLRGGGASPTAQFGLGR